MASTNRVLDNLPSPEYHADKSTVGVGGLSRLRRSPRHYWYHHLRPDATPEPPTPAQRFGSAVHTMVLEPDQFEGRYAVRPEGLNRSTTAGKAAWKEFEPTIGGRDVLTAAEFAAVGEIAAAVRTTAIGRELLLGDGQREASAYWTDPLSGVACRCRPDFAPSDKAILVDLKCTEDASDLAVGRTAVNFGWPMRAAWYVDGWRQATGEREAREYVFLVWEKEAPYCCAAYFADDDAIQLGRGQYQVLLGKYAECAAKNEWPGYFEQVQPLLLPAWYTGGK